MSDGGGEALAPLSAASQRLHATCTQLLAEAAATGSAEPLQRLLEQCARQVGDGRTHADRVSLLHRMLDESAAALQGQTARLRIWLPDLMEAGVRLDPARLAAPALTHLVHMTADENVNVVKKVLSFGSVLYPLVCACLSAWASSGAWAARAERARAEAAQLKSQLLAMSESPHEAIKPLVVKFAEVVALTLTNDRPNPTQKSANTNELRPFTLRDLPPHHPVLDGAKLREEATGVVQMLLSYTPAIASTFSALLKSLAALGRLRSSLFAGPVVTRLEELAELVAMEEAQLQLLPSQQQVKRIKADLKGAMLDVLRASGPSMPDADQLSARLVAALMSLGFDAEAREAVRQLEKKKAALASRQAANAQAIDLTGSGSAAATAAAPAVQYEMVASADSPEMQLLAYHLSQLPAASVTQLVLSSLTHFVPPSSALQAGASRQVSDLFVRFVAACSESNALIATRPPGTSLDQRQTAEMVLAQAAMATSTAPTDEQQSMMPLQPPALTRVPTGTLTTVPPVPIPTLSENAYAGLSRSAFARIASSRTQQSVSRSGESALRNVVLAKLAATHLLHPLSYTRTVDPELDNDDPAAEQWTASLLDTDNHQLLMSYITKDWGGSDNALYDSALNWLYSLLMVDGSAGRIETRIRQKDEDAHAADEDEQEEAQTTEDAAHMDDAGEEEAKADATPAKQSPADGATSTADAVAAGAPAAPLAGKRKREPEDSSTSEQTHTDPDNEAGVDGEAQPELKRLKGDDSASDSASVVLASQMAPSTLPRFDVHGTVEYNATLSRLLKSLESSPLFSLGGAGAAAGTSRQHLYSRFLLDIPLLTPDVFASIDGCVYDASRSVIGLSTLRDLILYRPPVRQQSLDLLLSYTHRPEVAKLRNQSIRLVVNQLFTPHPHLRDAIVEHANRLLDAIALTATLDDLPEVQVNVVVPPVPVYDKIVVPPAPQTKTGADAAAGADGDASIKSENAAVAPPVAPSQAGGETSRRALSDLKTRQEIAAMIADADRRKKEFDRLLFFRSLREKEKRLLEQQRDERVKRRTDRIARHMELFLALCTRQPSMFRRVLQVYARCQAFVRECVHQQIPPLITALMRLDMDTLIRVLEEETTDTADATRVADTPLGASASASTSEPLVLHVLQLLTDRVAPSAALVASVMRMYAAKGNDPRYLVCILGGLPLDAIRRHLPRLLYLPQEQLRQAFHKLLHSKPPSSIKPAELLVALHCLQVEPRKRSADQPAPSAEQMAKERKEDEDALDKRVVVAKKLCLDDTLAYPSEVVGVVLTQLSDMASLPRLLLHTLIVALRLHPSLRSFIVSTLLLKLISKKVYAQPLLWGGFLRAANELRPQSIPLLCQLPDHALEQLMLMPNSATLQLDAMRAQLVTFVQQYPMQVRHSVRKIVQHIEQEKAMHRQMQIMQMQQQQQAQ